MAKLTGPLMSLDAHGNYAKQMTFRRGRNGTHVYRCIDPRLQNQAPPTEAQQAVRTAYASLLTEWQALTTPEREDWTEIGYQQDPPISGWNAYVQEFLADRLQARLIRIQLVSPKPPTILEAEATTGPLGQVYPQTLDFTEWFPT